MNHPAPEPNDELRSALRRDAARLPEPAFDPALHSAILRRIRAFGVPPRASRAWWGYPALAAAVLVLIAAALWHPWSSHPGATKPAGPPDFTAILNSTRSSVASLIIEVPATMPAWMSPTAPLLDLPLVPPNL